MQNNTLWNLENADQAAKDIQFWQAEYMKRQFMSEPDYDVIVAQCNEIKRKWTMYLQNNKIHFFRKYENNIIHLQSNALALLTGSEYHDGNINFTDEFADFFTNPDTISILNGFNDVSFNYDYPVDSLINLTNMNNILLNISANLPAAPDFFMNKHYHKKFPEDVLTLIRIHPSDNTNVNIKKSSIWYSMFEERNTVNEEIRYENSNELQIQYLKRSVDFVVMGQSLHEDFKIEEVCQEIKDHIAWTIYEEKRKCNMALNNEEENAIISLYKRMAIGEYGINYRAARAIGLWLWDERHHFKNASSDADAVRALRGKGLDIEHTGSDDRTILRLLGNAKICIEKGQAVAINKQSGRPKKAHAV